MAAGFDAGLMAVDVRRRAAFGADFSVPLDVGHADFLAVAVRPLD